MNKPTYFVMVILTLAVLLIAACTPAATPAPAPTATPAPTPAAATAGPAPVAKATAAPAARPTVPPPPADDSRPLAKLSPAERGDRFGGPAPLSIKPNVAYQATILTDKGKIVAELYPDTVQGANNFVTLARNGFYDNLTFHRVEPGFVVQGGDPNGNGTGGPGYTIPAEINHLHLRGALAWARTGDEVNPERRSSGSQFYITLQETPFLDGQYSVFGQVIEGMEVVSKIAIGDKIQRVEISEAQTSRLPTPAPTPLPAPTPTPNPPKAAQGRPLAKLPVEQRENLYNVPPALTIDAAKSYAATIKSSKGDIVIELDTQTAPNAVNNFVMLADLGFYDGMQLAHVMPEPEAFVIMGSPARSPESHVGYNLDIEIGPQGTAIATGTVAMYPFPDEVNQKWMSNGSQFIIAMFEALDNPQPMSIIGKVAKGLDIAGQLTLSDTVTSITITTK